MAVKQFSKQGVVALLNTFRQSNVNYAAQLPVATVDNILSIQTTILKSDTMLNDFTRTVNKIVKQFVHSPSFKNPLAVFKTEGDMIGSTTEELFVELTKALAFDPRANMKRLYGVAKPDIKAAYHTINRAEMYEASVSEVEMGKAMISENGVSNLVTKIISTLTTSNERDEYLYMKMLIEGAYGEGGMYYVEVGDFDQNPEYFMEKAMEYSSLIPFVTSNNYNALGVANSSDVDDINVVLTAKASAKINVGVLSSAFNIDKVDLIGRRILVDKLADNNLVAALLDKSFFVVEDNLLKSTVSFNEANLTTKYFLHVRQTISRSPFATAIAFVREIPENVKRRLLLSEYAAALVEADETKTIYTEIGGYDSINPTDAANYTLEATVDNASAFEVSVNQEDKTVEIKPTANPERGATGKVFVTATFTDEEGGVLSTTTKEVVVQISPIFGQPEE